MLPSHVDGGGSLSYGGEGRDFQFVAWLKAPLPAPGLQGLDFLPAELSQRTFGGTAPKVMDHRLELLHGGAVNEVMSDKSGNGVGSHQSFLSVSVELLVMKQAVRWQGDGRNETIAPVPSWRRRIADLCACDASPVRSD